MTDSSFTQDRETTAEATVLVVMRWEDGRYGSIYGYVGSLKTSVATISPSTQRNDPLPYRVRLDLPGFRRTHSAATSAEGKALTERIVRSFLTKAVTAP